MFSKAWADYTAEEDQTDFEETVQALTQALRRSEENEGGQEGMQETPQKAPEETPEEEAPEAEEEGPEEETPEERGPETGQGEARKLLEEENLLRPQELRKKPKRGRNAKERQKIRAQRQTVQESETEEGGGAAFGVWANVVYYDPVVVAGEGLKSPGGPCYFGPHAVPVEAIDLDPPLSELEVPPEGSQLDGELPKGTKRVFGDPQLVDKLCFACKRMSNKKYNGQGKVVEIICGSCRSMLSRDATFACRGGSPRCLGHRYVDEMACAPGKVCEPCHKYHKAVRGH